MNQPETVKLPNFEVEYLKFGRGKKSLILLPGIGGSINVWMPTAQILASRYTIYLFSLPEYATNIPRGQKYLLFNQDKVVKDFVDHFGLNHINLIGHSLGAIAALQYANRHQNNVERLVLVAPPISSGKPPSLRRWRWTAKIFFHTRYLDSAFKHSVNQLKRAVDYIGDRFRPVPYASKIDFVHHLIKKVPPRSLARFYMDLFDTDLSHLPDANDRPTLVVYGKHDDYLEGFQLPTALKTKKNYKVEWLDCGHYLPKHCPQQLANLIHDYIN